MRRDDRPHARRVVRHRAARVDRAARRRARDRRHDALVPGACDPGYLRESAAYATVNGTITEAVEGARTTDALHLGARLRRRVDRNLREAFEAERYTLRLRSVLIPSVDAAFSFAPVAVLLWGGWLLSQGYTSVGAVTSVMAFGMQLGGPVFDLIFWLDELQVAGVSLSRVIGVRLVDQDREAGTAVPTDEHVVGTKVRYAYREGHDVLHDVDLDLRVGERLAIVGPSGAGKSTLGRMLAGIHPPTGGSVTVGDVPLVELPLEDLRRHVALVTQEHHVFVGTLADNLRLADTDATDEQLLDALEAVDARTWAEALPDGLRTDVGSGGHALTAAQAQQIALARLVLLDPHTLVLDEATSLLDPRAARHLERSLNGVLEGRTVVAIAHRLHTAHDADRVAVVDGGGSPRSGRTTTSWPRAGTTRGCGTRGSTSDRAGRRLTHRRAGGRRGVSDCRPAARGPCGLFDVLRHLPAHQPSSVPSPLASLTRDQAGEWRA
ncbi:hypothetical protein GCM10025864_04040 [Luteimicrobium album]|uniref:ABC transporter ATP-binding protein n=1 Tax=Luteimicrobium album TaxID=1054550 RepID=A0ABQ6HVY0_9MICO|nr:hypothetical protein GCM10025864_04040 [Luteimicrobium album]